MATSLLSAVIVWWYSSLKKIAFNIVSVLYQKCFVCGTTATGFNILKKNPTYNPFDACDDDKNVTSDSDSVAVAVAVAVDVANVTAVSDVAYYS